MTLSQNDLYAIARQLKGLSTDEINVTPATRAMINMMAVFQSKDSKVTESNLHAFLGADLANKVKAINPAGKLPTKADDDPVYVPALPKSAHLSEDALKQAETVGQWLKDFVKWASRRSPLTPALFLEAGGLWLMGYLIARRAVLQLSYTKIYPHLYILWVAPTGASAKSTGLSTIYDFANAFFGKHLLLPEYVTPEVFVAKLAGEKPSNYDDMPDEDRAIEDQGRAFAAWRGMIVDEASSLFLGKQYQEGQIELYLRLYDAQSDIQTETRMHGKHIVKKPALSLIGATTPARMARNVTDDLWLDGLMARFALLYAVTYDDPPDLDGSAEDIYSIPDNLLKRAQQLYGVFPAPMVADDGTITPVEPVSCAIDKAALTAFRAYHRAMRKLTKDVDEKLQGNYIRFAVQALKVAQALACMDWANSVEIGYQREGQPRITLGHWAKAQQIVETWRDSVHRLLPQVERSEDLLTQKKIIDLMRRRYGEKLTAREIQQNAHIKSTKGCTEAVTSLVGSGVLLEGQQVAKNGRAIKVYHLSPDHL